MKALDRLRKDLSTAAEGPFVTFGTPAEQESDFSRGATCARRKKEEEATNSLIKKETPTIASGSTNSYVRPGGSAKSARSTEPEIRGPCVHCGEAVGWHDGLQNWFGELVHHCCAGRWKDAPQSGERQRVGTCPRCRYAVFADNAATLGSGVVVHPICATK